MTRHIPRQRSRSPDCPSPLQVIAARLIRDAITHYPGGRIAACGLDYRQAQAVHRLIQTAQLDITWPTEDQ